MITFAKMQKDAVVGTPTGVLTLIYLEHRTILWLAGCYILLGGLALKALHRPWPIALTDIIFDTSWLTATVLWLVWQYARSPRRLRRALSAPRAAGAILIALIFVPIAITFQALKQTISVVIGFHTDRWLYHMDVLLHGRMGWEWLAFALARPRFVQMFDVLYLMWFPAVVTFMIWCSWTSHRVLRQRALTAFVLLWVIAGTILAAVLSSAGPVYYGYVVPGPNPYSALIDRLDAIQASGTTVFARLSEQYLWLAAHEPNKWHDFGGISAMPSLHVAVAVLLFLVASQRSRFLGIITALYAVGIQVSSVGLAWHYPMDGYAGAALAVLCWWIAARLQRPRELSAAVETEAIIHGRVRPSC